MVKQAFFHKLTYAPISFTPLTNRDDISFIHKSKKVDSTSKKVLLFLLIKRNLKYCLEKKKIINFSNSMTKSQSMYNHVYNGLLQYLKYFKSTTFKKLNFQYQFIKLLNVFNILYTKYQYKSMLTLYKSLFIKKRKMHINKIMNGLWSLAGAHFRFSGRTKKRNLMSQVKVFKFRGAPINTLASNITIHYFNSYANTSLEKWGLKYTFF
ncbi:MAG: hypothetical protein ACI7YS_16220 [Flavobacterium sp.]